MIPDPPMRLVVIGNSGAGKSSLATRIAAARALPACDLDRLHWHADGRKRAEAEARALVAEAAAGDAWIIEGVYGWLAEVALPRATALVWLDLPWAACRDGLLQRGLRRGMTLDDQAALMAWAEDYWTRTTPSSHAGHARLYRAFAGPKARLRTRDEAQAFAWETLEGAGVAGRAAAVPEAS